MALFKKAVVVGFLAMAFLVGCGDNEPSNSDIENQLSSRIADCPELSIADFQKLNGYPQSDGSYIDQIQYNILYTPSKRVLSYVKNYENTRKSVLKEGASDAVKVQTANGQISALRCNATYVSLMPALQLARAPLPGDAYFLSDIDNFNPVRDIKIIDMQISFVNDDIKSMQTDIAADQNLAWGYWPQQRVKPNTGTMIYMTREEATATDRYNLGVFQNDLSILETVRNKVETASTQLANCQGNEQQIVHNNQAAITHINNLNAELNAVRTQDLIGLNNLMNSECPLLMAQNVFNLNSVEAYAKLGNFAESENVHLVKSDNGWVIQ